MEPPSTQEDIVITMANGKVIQISPGFNAINVWESPLHFEMGDYDDTLQKLHVDLGGDI